MLLIFLQLHQLMVLNTRYNIYVLYFQRHFFRNFGAIICFVFSVCPSVIIVCRSCNPELWTGTKDEGCVRRCHPLDDSFIPV